MSESPPVKAVFDCNVFLQALGNPQGASGRCLQAVWDGRVQLFVDARLLDELSDVAQRPKMLRRFPKLTSRFHRLMEQIGTVAVIVQDVPDRFTLSRDPDDAHYVNLAIATGAFLVVTRDKDLLDLMREESVESRTLHKSYPEFRILTPPEFLVTLAPVE